MVAMLPIAAMLGKADTAFKAVGGSSIIFNLWVLGGRRAMGSVCMDLEGAAPWCEEERAVTERRAPPGGVYRLEVCGYPDGDLQSFQIYRMNIERLREVIADAQPPPFPTAFLKPKDVKQISVWTSPHFTESVKTDADVRAIPDGGWVFWSKDSADEDAIPRRGVKLDGSHVAKKNEEAPSASRSDWASDQTLQDTAIRLSRELLMTSQQSSSSPSSLSTSSSSSISTVIDAGDSSSSSDATDDAPHPQRASPLSRSFAVLPNRRARRRPPPPSLTQWQYDRLVDLAVDADAGILTLARNFGDDPAAFRRAALRLLSRRDPSAILLSATPGEVLATAAGGEGGTVGATDDDSAGSSSPLARVEPQVELASRS
ncbi:hypothetical protein MMPV_009334 [Pyropia vietnamensis]